MQLLAKQMEMIEHLLNKTKKEIMKFEVENAN